MEKRKKKKTCPQCKIGRFQLKNEKGESIVVTVDEAGKIEPIYPEQSMDGFSIDVLYCLGCSWKGSIKQLL